ncbi:hypothetical protein [Arenimonas daejeonensis]|uniref:hypothetical protein n=1 Tax=Arenimonas daejeonensis TaxID=370777 RepID=UPI0013150456|nr:hypothetical protein [Arenimonas daejeonensis]
MIDAGGGNRPLVWMALLAVLFLGLRACDGPLAPVDAQGWRAGLAACAAGARGRRLRRAAGNPAYPP